MSHFCVLVIGDKVDDQLRPYHEFECTGVNDEYVQEIDNTEEARKDYEKHGDKEMSFLDWVKDYYGSEVLAAGLNPDLEDTHKYWYVRLTADGEVDKVIRRTNPNAKWDWWVIGGRWTGFLKLRAGANGATGKPGVMTEPAKPRYADIAAKQDVDFDGMRNEAAADAAERYDRIRSVIDPHLEGFITWEKMRDEVHAGDIETARSAYHAQALMRALSNAHIHLWDGPDEFLMARDAYIQAARDNALSPYAIVRDGQWLARGKMGWFGFSDDHVDQEAWNREVYKLLESLPNETPLTVVDCHI